MRALADAQHCPGRLCSWQLLPGGSKTAVHASNCMGTARAARVSPVELQVMAELAEINALAAAEPHCERQANRHPTSVRHEQCCQRHVTASWQR